jgi:hypothetical protein
LVGALVLVGLVLLVAGTTLTLVNWPTLVAHLQPIPDSGSLKGELIVRVWTDDRSKRGRQIGVDPDAAPVRYKEWLHLETRLNQPAYVYVLWVDGKGVVTPLYPWNVGKLVHKTLPDTVPPQDPAAVVHSPTHRDEGWPEDETQGLDTMLLLARKTPLPQEVLLAEVIGEVSPAPLGPHNEVVVRGLDRGMLVEEVKLDQNRRPFGDAAKIDDQLLQLMERLSDHFELIRAIQFAHFK